MAAMRNSRKTHTVESQQPMKPSRRSTPGGRRRWLRGLVFRLLAVIVGLAPLAAAEVLFWALDWGRPTYDEDPFVGFSEVHPLFVLDDDGARYEVARSRQEFFCPESFAAEKADDEYRIFFLGGSTVQGRPFAIQTSITAWLEIDLTEADSRRRWEVVNCGGVSYASYRLVPILEEVLGYDPDLIILYTGHNEFLEDRTYGHIKHLPAVVAGPSQWVMQTRTYTLLRRGYLRLRGRCEKTPPEGRPVLGSETDAQLEYRDGLKYYRRDDKWRRDVIEHFSYNLRRMVHMARHAGVPLMLVNPVSNLRDCAPFKTQNRDDLTAEQLDQWRSLVARARERAFRTETRPYADLPGAVELLKRAIAIDDRHAGVHYQLATCYDGLGLTDQARASYTRAKEEDVCPLRILEPMHEAIVDIARQTDTPLVDVRELFRQHDKTGIPGNFLLLDHVHPSIKGHQLIAEALTEELICQGIVRPVPDWKQRAQQKSAQHHASLDDFYFNKGMQRLEALRLWSQGKGNRVRP